MKEDAFKELCEAVREGGRILTVLFHEHQICTQTKGKAMTKKPLWKNARQRHVMIGKLLASMPKKKAAILVGLYEDAMQAENDSAYWEAKYKGTWPGDEKSKKVLTHACLSV